MVYLRYGNIEINIIMIKYKYNWKLRFGGAFSVDGVLVAVGYGVLSWDPEAFKFYGWLICVSVSFAVLCSKLQ